MAQERDPFLALRQVDEVRPADPFDCLEAHERDDTELQIRQAYETFATSDTIAAMTKPDGVAHCADRWKNTIQAALVGLPAFQRLVVDDFISWDVHDFQKVTIDRDWLIGLYLEGFYDIYDSFDGGYEDVLQDMTVSAIRAARATLESLLRNKVTKEIEIVQ